MAHNDALFIFEKRGAQRLYNVVRAHLFEDVGNFVLH